MNNLSERELEIIRLIRKNQTLKTQRKLLKLCLNIKNENHLESKMQDEMFEAGFNLDTLEYENKTRSGKEAREKIAFFSTVKEVLYENY